MFKTIIAATLSTLACTAYATTEIEPNPENVYSFEIHDKLNSFQGVYSVPIDKSILFECQNKEEGKDNAAYKCQFHLETVKDFDINNKNVIGIQMLIMPLAIEKDVLKANIVYKQRINQTNTLDYYMTDHPLRINDKTTIKLNNNNEVYITLKKVIY